MLAVKESTVSTIKRDHAASARLSLLAEQVDLLQQQAQQAVDESELHRMLSEIGMSCRIVPGTVYYHYTQNGKDTLSRIAPEEWANYDVYHAKYLYDYDFTFRKLIGDATTYDWHTVPAHTLLLHSSESKRPKVAEQEVLQVLPWANAPPRVPQAPATPLSLDEDVWILPEQGCPLKSGGERLEAEKPSFRRVLSRW
jgi:hypothetical protein